MSAAGRGVGPGLRGGGLRALPGLRIEAPSSPGTRSHQRLPLGNPSLYFLVCLGFFEVKSAQLAQADRLKPLFQLQQKRGVWGEPLPGCRTGLTPAVGLQALLEAGDTPCYGGKEKKEGFVFVSSSANPAEEAGVVGGGVLLLWASCRGW